MKKVIKASLNTEATNNSEIQDGYRQELAYGYIGKKVNGQLSINKPRPYDDADYYWALYDEVKKGWKIIYRGKVANIMLDEDIDDIDEVAEMLEMINGPIHPKMIHN